MSRPGRSVERACVGGWVGGWFESRASRNATHMNECACAGRDCGREGGKVDRRIACPPAVSQTSKGPVQLLQPMLEQCLPLDYATRPPLTVGHAPRPSRSRPPPHVISPPLSSVSPPTLTVAHALLPPSHGARDSPRLAARPRGRTLPGGLSRAPGRVLVGDEHIGACPC